MRAYIQPARGGDPRSIQAKSIATSLIAAKIEINDRVKERIRAFVDKASASRGQMEKFLIAEARMPVEARDGEFLWDCALCAIDGSAGQKSRDDREKDENEIESRIICSAVVVEPSTLIGKVTPPKPGLSGVNVLGHPLPPKKDTGEPVELGGGISFAEDGVTVVANRKGRVVYNQGRISLHEVIVIDRDIKPGTNKTDWDSDIIIRGDVGHGANIAGERSIIVTNTVCPAEIHAGESIIVHYGVTGQSKGRIQAEMDVVVKFCEEADIHAGRDILIGNNVVNSRLHAGRRVHAPGAPIIGGEIRARLCIEAQSLGSDGGLQTLIGVGASMEVIKQAAELDEANRDRREKLEKYQAALVPLQANLKRLDSMQKEKATELCFFVSELEAEITEAEERRKKLLSQANEGAYISVHSTIHEGVQLTIGDRVTIVNRQIDGPVRIERRKIRGATELVAIYDNDRGVAVLKNKRIG